MLIKNKGIRTDKYFIPPFELKEGELVVICICNGAHYHDIKMELVDIFTGKIKNDTVEITQPLTFVEHFIEPTFRRMFYPVTVGEFIKQRGGNEKDIIQKVCSHSAVYDIASPLTTRTKVNSLEGTPRKLLSLYTTLSNTDTIIFDLDGQSPQGAQETYEMVKNSVKGGGAAIFIDWTEDMKNDCTLFVKIEWVDHP